MDVRKFIIKKVILIGVVECVLIALMSLVFLMLDKFDVTVVIGGVVGAILATANFFFMAIAADAAADSAVQQDVKGGKNRMRSSYMMRIILIFILLFVFAKTGWANPFALVIPFLIVRPIISVDEFFRKPGKKENECKC